MTPEVKGGERLRTDAFDFDLPRDRIAERPVFPRDASRMLVVDRGLRDAHVRDLPNFVRSEDILIVNDTRVVPTRLSGRRGAAKIEVTLHKNVSPQTWWAFAKPAKRLRVGDRVVFAPEFEAAVAEKREGGGVRLVFHGSMDVLSALERYGAMPLPPYISRDQGADARDRDDYQTVFARHAGAVAAPTAGLHFTDELLRVIDGRGIKRAQLTLHVGAGTFLPVKAEFVDDHRMHSEWGTIDERAAEAINTAREAGGRVVAVGTTVLRLLESAVGADGRIAPFTGETSIFITPGYRFRAVDVLMTNFHLPRSTLFMLVSAFSGLERMKAAYRHAVEAGYRFYSYGDATLLFREPGR
jgi:S-adenosylmethionine:tRNA ribosyltransferase-isomerase